MTLITVTPAGRSGVSKTIVNADAIAQIDNGAEGYMLYFTGGRSIAVVESAEQIRFKAREAKARDTAAIEGYVSRLRAGAQPRPPEEG